MKNCLIFLVMSFLLGLLTSCSSNLSTTEDGPPPGYEQVDVNKIPNAQPDNEPHSKYGNQHSYVVDHHRYYVLKSAVGYKQRGIASWYGIKFHKQLTSDRETYNMFAMTAANKVLPLPTFVRVTNLENGRQIIVKVNDRGPFVANRIIDLSYVAAKKLNMLQHGTALVEVEALTAKQVKIFSKAPTSVTYATPRKAHIYLQLGAYASRPSAQVLAAKVQKMGKDPVHLVTASHNGQELYKVQVGPIDSVSRTDMLTARYKRAGFGDAFAVVQ